MPPLSSGPQAAIIGLAIRFRGIVVTLAAVLLGYGLYALGHARYDVFPEFAPPQVAIQTEAPGLAPEQVEQLVTRPIETAVDGVTGVTALRSSSIQGLSVVTAYFDPESNVYRDRQVVAEQLAVAARGLPATVRPPTMTPLTSSTGIVLVAGLTSATRSLMHLRTAADWTVRLRLLAVPGVAGVAVFGGDVRSLQVQVHPDRLIHYGLSLDDVLAAARRATGVRGAGFVDTRNQRVLFRTRGQSLHTADLARTVLLRQASGVVTLGDVATVADAPEPPIGGASVEGRPGVVLASFARDAEQAIRARVTLPAGSYLEFAGAAQAQSRSRRALLVNGLLGGIGVVLLLSIVTRNWRNLLLVLANLPFALVGGVLAVFATGGTMSLGSIVGFVTLFGITLRNSIMMISHYEHLVEAEDRRWGPETAVEGAANRLVPILMTSLVTALGLLPLALGMGDPGREVEGPMAVVILGGLLTSMALNLLVLPTLALRFGRFEPAQDEFAPLGGSLAAGDD